MGGGAFSKTISHIYVAVAKYIAVVCELFVASDLEILWDVAEAIYY